MVELEAQLEKLHRENTQLLQLMHAHLDSDRSNLHHITTPQDFIDEYIDLLHKYNDAKDFGQFLLGKLALIKQCTVSSLYQQFGLETTD